MNVSSMTGYAARDGSIPDARWTWELRSVNSRGLDLKIRLPQGAERLEPEIRQVLATAFARGSISVSLNLRREFQPLEIRLNEAALEHLIAATRVIAERHGAQPPPIETLLSVRGVVELTENNAVGSDEDLHQTLLQGLSEAVAALASARRSEGERLAAILEDQVDQIERLAQAARQAQPARAERMKARLASAVAGLLDAGAQLDADRLHQEAVLLAAKADVQEEIDRTQSHVAAARTLLAQGGPIGRKLDFLSQELNREANTLCSKSGDSDLTNIGLALKAVIDQFREQVQNVE